jgi:hypothetical protein
MLELTELMPDCWQEVSLHLEGPATNLFQVPHAVMTLVSNCDIRQE